MAFQFLAKTSVLLFCFGVARSFKLDNDALSVVQKRKPTSSLPDTSNEQYAKTTVPECYYLDAQVPPGLTFDKCFSCLDSVRSTDCDPGCCISTPENPYNEILCYEQCCMRIGYNLEGTTITVVFNDLLISSSCTISAAGWSPNCGQTCAVLFDADGERISCPTGYVDVSDPYAYSIEGKCSSTNAQSDETSTATDEPDDETEPDSNTESTTAPTKSANTTEETTTSTSTPKASSSQPACFSASATVQLESGARKEMKDLAVGDRVLVAPFTYSDVFMFTHRKPDILSTFVTITTESGYELSLTEGHYLYINGNLVAAGSINVGDVVELHDGNSDTVRSIASTQRTGLYNPQTLHGDIVVDGVLTSTYTTMASPGLGHAALSMFRFAYSKAGMCPELFESGREALQGVFTGSQIVS